MTVTDDLPRCGWQGEDPLYVAYHDIEWGVPEFDSRALFEKLILDGFQAGLAWITILRKRENFRRAFEGFIPEKIARYTEADVARLMGDAGIVRSGAKINAAITAARLWLKVEETHPDGFAGLIWKHVDGMPVTHHYRTPAEVPAQNAMSEALSKELKSLGFKFCGPVIVYAFAEAVGMVNDHLTGCFRHGQVAALRREFCSTH